MRTVAGAGRQARVMALVWTRGVAMMLALVGESANGIVEACSLDVKLLPRRISNLIQYIGFEIGFLAVFGLVVDFCCELMQAFT